LEVEFEEIERGAVKPNTEIGDLFDWNSMNALLIMAMVKTEFDADILGDELTECLTILDIYNLVQSKIGA
jgi:acyl carrier protein